MVNQSGKQIVNRSWITLCAIGSGLLVGGAWIFARLDGLAGILLGGLLAVITLGSLRLLTNSLIPTEQRLPRTSSTTVLLLLLKLPLVAVILFLMRRLSAEGVACFLVALLLVYSSFVWRLSSIDD